MVHIQIEHQYNQKNNVKSHYNELIELWREGTQISMIVSGKKKSAILHLQNVIADKWILSKVQNILWIYI